jgi:hypothetical protein
VGMSRNDIVQLWYGRLVFDKDYGCPYSLFHQSIPLD